jgi:hypothetical protein
LFTTSTFLPQKRAIENHRKDGRDGLLPPTSNMMRRGGGSPEPKNPHQLLSSLSSCLREKSAVPPVPFWLQQTCLSPERGVEERPALYHQIRKLLAFSFRRIFEGCVFPVRKGMSRRSRRIYPRPQVAGIFRQFRRWRRWGATANAGVGFATSRDDGGLSCHEGLVSPRQWHREGRGALSGCTYCFMRVLVGAGGE